MYQITNRPNEAQPSAGYYLNDSKPETSVESLPRNHPELDCHLRWYDDGMDRWLKAFLRDNLGFTRVSEVRHFNARVLIANFLRLEKDQASEPLRLSLQHDYWCLRKQTISKKLSGDSIERIIDRMVHYGYLEKTPGFFTKDRWFQTRIKTTGKFAELVGTSEICSTAAITSTAPLIVLRKKRGDSENYDLLKFPKTQRVREMEEVLRNYNDLLGSTKIGFYAPMLNEIYDVQKKRVRRVFNISKSLDLGGRFYGPFWVGLPKHVRKQLTINGEPTVELDYQAQHIHLLYAKEGIDYANDLGGDPYDLAGYDRKHVKLAVLMSLNCASDDSSWRAFKNECLRSGNLDGYKQFYFKKPYIDLLDSFFEKHSRIAHYRYEEVGLELQFLDSLIAEAVIKEMTESHKIPILCIHDSFVCNKDDEDLLLRAMIQAPSFVARVSMGYTWLAYANPSLHGPD